MLDVGDTEILFVVAPLFQEYVAAPDAVNTTEFPEQMVALFTATVGVAFTFTVVTFVFVHPLDVPITV